MKSILQVYPQPICLKTRLRDNSKSIRDMTFKLVNMHRYQKVVDYEHHYLFCVLEGNFHTSWLKVNEL